MVDDGRKSMVASMGLTHPWGHILWRDRLLVLTVMILCLLGSVALLAVFPRDYVAQAYLTQAPYRGKAASIDWNFESQQILSDDVIAQVENTLNPVQSLREFSGFRALKLNGHAAPAMAAAGIELLRGDLAQKTQSRVRYDARQTAIGMDVFVRSDNPAEVLTMARAIVESYLSIRHDHMVKIRAQDTGKIRASVLQKRKTLVVAEAQLGQYIQTNRAALKPIGNDVNEKARADLVQQLKADIAAAQTRYGPKHPVMIELNARVNAMEQQSLTKDGHADLVQQTINALQHDVDMARADLEQYITQNGAGLSPAQESDLTEIIQPNPIRLNKDYSFDRALILTVTGLGFLLGVMVVVVRHLLCPTLQQFNDLPRLVASLPCVGRLSYGRGDVVGDGGVRAASGGIAMTSIPAERITALKTIRHDMRLRFDDPKLLVVTSDGDDLLWVRAALEMGRVAARAGEKVMVLEANWHRPQLYQLAANDKNRTIIDYLAGQFGIDAVLNRDDPSGVHIIHGGDIPMTAIDLLSGTKFSNLLLSFRQIYDLVILIAPPVAQGADTPLLSKIADATMVSMVADQSHPNRLLSSVKILQDSKISRIFTTWIYRAG